MSSVFTASRWTRGNFLFPTRFEITADSVVRRKRRWLTTDEATMHLSRIASVGIQAGVLFADVRIESTGGGEDLVSHGHWKGDARAIRDIIQDWQTRNLPPSKPTPVGRSDA